MDTQMSADPAQLDLESFLSGTLPMEVVITASALSPVVDLPALAFEINDAHQQVEAQIRSTLLDAKRAGEALLQAKAMLGRGEFMPWVEARCAFSYRTAAAYMRVAKVAAEVADLCKFESIDALLSAYRKPREGSTSVPVVVDATFTEVVTEPPILEAAPVGEAVEPPPADPDPAPVAPEAAPQVYGATVNEKRIKLGQLSKTQLVKRLADAYQTLEEHGLREPGAGLS